MAQWVEGTNGLIRTSVNEPRRSRREAPGHESAPATGVMPGEPGAYDIGEDSAMVFVLIPGGTFRMGAELPSEDRPLGYPNVDPRASPSEQPVHEVTLDPFLISKYEMTQGQWHWWTGNNPSRHQPGTADDDGITLAHPVEWVLIHEPTLL